MTAASKPAQEANTAWRLRPFSRQPAGEQTALAAAMLSAAEGPALRWRQIVPEALLLGPHKPWKLSTSSPAGWPAAASIDAPLAARLS